MPLLSVFHRSANARTPEFLRQAVLISFLITSALALLVLVSYFRIQPEVPLFYSLARPTEQLVRKEWLFIIPGLSLLISVSHLLIMRVSINVNQLLLQLFAWTTIGMQTLLALSLLRIILIIT